MIGPTFRQRELFAFIRSHIETIGNCEIVIVGECGRPLNEPRKSSPDLPHP
jgi:hypothetical protein